MPIPSFITKYRLLPQHADCWLWPRKVKSLSRQPVLHWQISGDTNELVRLHGEQQLLPPGQPSPKMPLLCPKPFLNTHKSHHHNNASAVKEETAPSIFALTPSRRRTLMFTTSTTLLPPRTVMHSMFLQRSYTSDRRNYTGESKQTPEPGTKPTDQGMYCSDDTPWEAPTPPPPSPGSM